MDRFASGIRAGERAVLARAITLIESKRPDHQHQARRLVQDLLPDTGKAMRVGITGAPGVGKSTTVDALGTYLTGHGHGVAVLAVEPDREKGRIRIVAEARDLPTALAYIERLQKSRALRFPMLDSHEVRTDDHDQPVRFQLSAEWSTVS